MFYLFVLIFQLHSIMLTLLEQRINNLLYNLKIANKSIRHPRNVLYRLRRQTSFLQYFA